MIRELEQELIGLVQTVPVFAGKGFSIFDLDDLEAKAAASVNYPVVGVGYNGSSPAEGNQADTLAKSSRSVTMVNAFFIIVVGIQYGYTGQDETKPSAFDLLDQVRGVVSGYMSVNSRPWRFISERPEPSASGDGVAFYSQVWQTAFVSNGTFNKP